MFKVPLIPPDLRHEETIIQAAYALDCLQNTIATIFGRIDKRIEKNNAKVKQLQERIGKSQAKINSLQGTRKAIRIYAPARFPSSTIFKDLPATFSEGDNVQPRSVGRYNVESTLDPNLPNINEKLIFFHVRDQNSVKLTPESPLAKERYNIKQNQNLGNMPSDLRSVPSVLLFNTDSSVYNLHECDSDTSGHSDAWKRAKLFKNKRQQQQSSSAKQILEPAPHSLLHRRNDRLTPSGGLKYTPKLTEAPELDLPLDLPDLPGIADDLRYESLEAKQKIGPSLALVVESLPELTELMKDNAKKSQISIEGFEYNRTNVPPPPPPLPAVLSMAPPPPPPPPPAPSIEQQVSQVKTDAGNKTKISSSSMDTRSDLMAAIRNAGGLEKAHLRPTAAAPLSRTDNDVVDNTRPKNSSSKTLNSLSKPHGGDLMADLHNKLLMRRKGISGSKDNKDEASNIKNVDNTASSNIPSGNPLLSRLSSLIPPPPSVTKNKNCNTATTSGEDDEDDSNDTDWVD